MQTSLLSGSLQILVGHPDHCKRVCLNESVRMTKRERQVIELISDGYIYNHLLLILMMNVGK